MHHLKDANMAGFLSLSRDIEKWEWAKDTKTFALFVRLLLQANYEDGKYHGIEVKRGQLVTGLKTLSQQVGLSIQQTRTAISHIQLTGEITINSTNKYSIITICNYDRWTFNEERDNNQINNQTNIQSTHNQQTNPHIDNNIQTNKEINNKKEDTIVSKKEKPLWKTSYDEYKRLFEEAKQELLVDSVFKAKQEDYFPGIDYIKSIERNMDYWLKEDTWKKVAREKAQTIRPKERIKNNFDKNKAYKPRFVQDEQKKEATFIDRHTKYVQWIAEHVTDPNTIMPILHVTLDDFIEMFNSCGGNSSKLAEITISLLRGRMNKGESLISAFRRNEK